MSHDPLSQQRRWQIPPRKFLGGIGGRFVDAAGRTLYTPRVLFINQERSCARVGFSPDKNLRKDFSPEDVKHPLRLVSSVGTPAIASRLDTLAEMPGTLLPDNIGGNLNDYSLVDNSCQMHCRALTANFFFSSRPNTECDNDLLTRQTPRTILTTLRKRPAVTAPS
jgi:hypothetical protein